MPSEDSEFFSRMLFHDAKLQFVPDCLVLYRLHEMGQITASGTSKNHRIIDWENFLQIVESQLIESQIRVDPLTWLIFQAQRRKSLKYLNTIPDRPQSIDKNNSSNYSPFLGTIYGAINFSKRIESGLRGRLTGSRYSRPYQTSYPTEYQLQLIRNMGYEPVS
jgi:hypothetical protein